MVDRKTPKKLARMPPARHPLPRALMMARDLPVPATVDTGICYCVILNDGNKAWTSPAHLLRH